MLMLLTLAIPALLLGISASDDGDDSNDETIRGAEGDDALEGGDGNDFLVGNEGNDVMEGNAGNDVLFGNEGEDVLRGGDGRDMLCAGDDDDIISGNRGEDTIEGQGGNDWVNGDYSEDTVQGNDGNDTVIGGRGEDIVAGQNGDDIVLTGFIDASPVSTDNLVALRDGEPLEDALESESNLRVRDDAHADRAFGGEGNDTILFGGEDTATGGAGADLFGVFATQELEGSAVIEDMTTEDSLAVVYQTFTPPALSIEADGADAVLRDGDTVLAVIRGAAGQINVSDISLIRSGDIAQQLDPNG